MISNATNFIENLSLAKPAAGELKTPDIYMHPDLIGEGGRFSKKTLNGADYVVIANTATDANIIFKDVEIHSYFGGKVSGSVTPQIFSDTATMTVIEPFGSRFVEYILNACALLHVNQMQAIFVLKTLFVGHRDDGEVEIISNYAPFTFFIDAITFAFTSASTIYNISAIPMTNGIGNVPAFSCPGLRSFAVEGITVLAFMERLDQMIKENVSLTEKSIKDKNPNSKDTVVSYSVVIDKNAPYSGSAYELSTQIHDHSKEGTPNKWVFTPSTTSITDTIMDAIAHCPAIQAEQKANVFVDGVATVYVPDVVTTTTQTVENDQIHTHLTYTLIRRPQTVFTHEAESKSASTTAPVAVSETANQEKFQKFLATQLEASNLLEFDFIFSGKNDDVLKFDMMFNFGLGALINSVTTSESLSQSAQIHNVSGVELNKAVSGNLSIHPVNEPGKPVLTQYTKSSPIKEQAAFDQFQLLLRRYAVNETFAAELEIMGNPRLFQQCTHNPDSPTATEQGDVTPPYARSGPLYVKINVYMPQIDVTTGSVDFTQIPEKGFQSPFWFQGIFFVSEIKNSFNDGTFRQTLTLYQGIVSDTIATTAILDGNDTGATTGDVANRSGESVKAVTAVKPSVVSTTACRSIKKKIIVPDGTDGGTGSSNVKAFLKTIRVCEGTYPSVFGEADDNGYKRIVTGPQIRKSHKDYKEFIALNEHSEQNNLVLKKVGSADRYFTNYTSPYKGHPRFYVQHDNSSDTTSAAGAYQIVYKTWNGLQIKLPDMTKTNQDKAAVQLLKDRNALKMIKAGQIMKALNETLITAEWASLGQYYEGQMGVCPDDIVRIFTDNGGVLDEIA
jgi:hypothetical protein